jgi:CDP-glucose 4,6-dehydratase
MEGVAVTLEEAWQGRRVFLTGHTGFKGSWLSLWLARLGATVTGYALAPPTIPNLFDLADVASAVGSMSGDIRDLAAFEAAFRDARPEIVIHMAAQPLVRASYHDPLGTYSTNVMGTANLLDIVRRSTGVRAVIIVTSDKSYANREQIWGYREFDPMGGHDPYSSSKGCAELVTSAFRDSYFNPARFAEHGVAVASVRAGNVIGGGDWATDRLVADAIRAFLERRSVEIRNPSAIRPWQHVLEPLHGYLCLGAALLGERAADFAQAWNFGPGSDGNQPVAAIVDVLTDCWGDGAAWSQVGDRAGLHEAHHLHLDCTKAKLLLGWQSVYHYRKAVALTVDWFKAFAAGADMRSVTMQQLEGYMALVESMATSPTAELAPR